MGVISVDEFSRALKLDRFFLQKMALPIMRITGIQAINELQDSLYPNKGIDFLDGLVDKLAIKVIVDDKELDNIPKTGGFVVLSNHPYGMLDGIILTRLMARARPDYKVMANFLLNKVEPLQEFFIGVDPFERDDAKTFNIKGIKQALSHLQQDAPLGIFPAGEVSAISRKNFSVTDKEWSPVITRIIDKAQKPVLPVYFEGHNSSIFNMLGIIHSSLRTMRLPKELLNKKGAEIHIRIGKPIQPAEYSIHSSVAERTTFLRARTYALGNVYKPGTENTGNHVEVIDAVTSTGIELQKEIDALLPADKILTEQQYDLYITGKENIPLVMNEIGRLREITFREVGEGSNKALDIDEFDEHYKHLFLWDREAGKLAGAYRVGCGADICRAAGIEGFYSNTLFKMDEAMKPILSQSLELGRSFIRREYQQKALPLMLLWRGIMLYATQHPEYRYLFGPVSISNRFSKLSKAIMIHYIKMFCYDKELSKLVEARKEFKSKAEEEASKVLVNEKNASLASVDGLVAQIELNHYGIPVLLKKYIKQNAKIIGFNIDPMFNNALDGLMILDIRQIPADTVRMLGKNNEKQN